MMVGLKRISTAFGLLAAMASAATAQGVAPSPNQMTADAVAGSLRSSRTLSGHRIEIEASDGVVTLTGTLASPAQKPRPSPARAGRRASSAWSTSSRWQRPVGPPGPVPAPVALGHHRR